MTKSFRFLIWASLAAVPFFTGISSVRAQTPAALKKIESEITSRVEPFRSDGIVSLPMPAILSSALRPR